MSQSNLTSPQDLLDDMHSANVPSLFVPQMSARQRASMIQQCKMELDGIRVGLDDQISKIQKKHKKDKDKRKEKIERAPYTQLESLLTELIKAVENLESRVKAGKLLPQGFEFGEAIFGDKTTGEWHIDSLQDAQRWDHMETSKRRLISIKEERAPIGKEIKEIKANMGIHQREAQTLMKKYKKRHAKGYFRRRAMVLGFVGLAFIAAGAYLFMSHQMQLLGGAAIGLGLVFWLLIPVINHRRQAWIHRTREKIQAERQTLKQLKAQGKKLHRRLIPVQEMIESFQAEYEDLRSTF